MGSHPSGRSAPSLLAGAGTQKTILPGPCAAVPIRALETVGKVLGGQAPSPGHPGLARTAAFGKASPQHRGPKAGGESEPQLSCRIGTTPPPPTKQRGAVG